MVLELRDRALPLEPPVVVGILNLAPDSFSDGGEVAGPGEAARRAERLVAEGALLVDLGAESTRPGAEPVPLEVERKRLIPALRAVLALGVAVSVDTRKPELAEEALDLGAHLVNDTSGLADLRMAEVAGRYRAPLVVMHTPDPDPRRMMAAARYLDVVAEVRAFLITRARRAERAGVHQVILDPGIGFGKLAEHNLALLGRLDEIASLGYPVLVGASRKRTIGELTGVADPAERACGSVGAHLAAVKNGARLIRVHDVAAHREALAVFWAVEGRGQDRP